MTAVRLDEVVHGPVDLIKLDVEGHEPAALEGMRRLIARSHPVIVSECNEYLLESCSNTSGRDYIALLNSYGYDVFDLNDLSVAVTPDSPPRHVRIFDVVALPRKPVADERSQARAVTTMMQNNFLESYMAAFDRIEGWFSPDAALMFMAYNEVISAHEVTGNMLEIGVHHGLSAIALSAMRNDGAQLVAVDLFEQLQERTTALISCGT